MEKHDLGALVCFVGENVRYITSVYQGNWKNNIFIRYCVLPRGGEPVLFETAGSDLECAKIDAPWLNGNIRPAITWKWAETAEQMMADKMVAVDRLRAEGGRGRERADRDRHLRPERGGRVRAGRREDDERVAGDVGRARREDAGRARVPEDLERDRRHVVLEDRARVAEAGREGELHHRQGERVPLRAGLRLRLRHHRRVGRQHEPVPPLAHRQGDPRGRPRDRRPERDRARRLLRRLRPLLQGRRPLDAEGEGPLQGVLRVDVRRDRDDEGGQHDRRRRGEAPEVRRRRVRHRHAAAVRALDRALALRGHVDLARLLARVSGRARGEHVLRLRDLRRPSRPRADRAPGGEPARHEGRARHLHQAPVRRRRPLG